MFGCLNEYISMVLTTYDFAYVVNNYTILREDYYAQKLS